MDGTVLPSVLSHDMLAKFNCNGKPVNHSKPLMSFLFLVIVMSAACLQSAAQSTERPLPEQVFQAICAAGIRHPEIVMRQAIVETGWMRSPHLMEKNNLFGFRQGQYLRFAHWRESIAYYAQWQKRKYQNPDEDYYTFLARIGYARAGNYINYLRKIKWQAQCTADQITDQ